MTQTFRQRLIVVVSASILSVMLMSCGGPTAKTHAVFGGNGAPQYRSTTTKPGAPSSSTTTSSRPPGGAPQSPMLAYQVGTPNWVARKFVYAEQSLNYTDLVAPNGFATWAVNIKPYCTPSYYAPIAAAQRAAIANNDAVRNGNGPQQLIANKESMYPNITDSAIISDAGYGPTHEWVQVTYYMTTSIGWQQSTGPTQVEQLYLIKLNGKWLVDKENASPVN